MIGVLVLASVILMIESICIQILLSYNTYYSYSPYLNYNYEKNYTYFNTTMKFVFMYKLSTIHKFFIFKFFIF